MSAECRAGRARSIAVRVLGVLTAAWILGGCANGAVVTTISEYRAEALEGKRLYVTRLAVSDDYADARSGVMLSHRTRAVATNGACIRIAEAWPNTSVVCPYPDQTEPEPIQQLERRFALGERMTPQLLEAARASVGCDYLLLFRPESADSVQELTRTKILPDALYVKRDPLRDNMDGNPNRQFMVENETELSYTVGGMFVDARSATILRAGYHSGSASRTTKNNPGFAQAPPAAPLLTEVMAELGERLLDD